ncbi:MAG: glycine cleavage system protein T [Gammaproteobacteria bacterium]|nr:glycine cleavage system protein T [Gammaproteobacteria bacterium]
MTHTISPSPRVRTSPYFQSTLREGAKSFTPYNRMLMPTSYGEPDEEYDRLINGVAMWDVAVERQVQLEGPDATRLAQVLTPRKIANMSPGQGWYIALCDHRGVLINDPILLKHSDEKYWLSIADSDVLVWTRAIAAERGFDVRISEPDVSPLAVQGPKAEDVVAALLGDEVREIRHFRFREMMLDDIPLVLARSGWSRQGGFELYLEDSSRGVELWERVKQAGEPWGIGPGNPNPSERIESGLLSWGGDTDDDTNPFEVRMGRYVDLDAPDDVIGIQALRSIYEQGVKRHQLGIIVDSEERLDYQSVPAALEINGQTCGKATALAWSPRLQKNIGIGLVDREVVAGDEVLIGTPMGIPRHGLMTELPFI